MSYKLTSPGLLFVGKMNGFSLCITMVPQFDKEMVIENYPLNRREEENNSTKTLILKRERSTS